MNQSNKIYFDYGEKEALSWIVEGNQYFRNMLKHHSDVFKRVQGCEGSGI